MRRRYWLALIVGLSVGAVAATLLALPELIRLGAIARIQAMTDRRVSIDRVDVSLLKGHLTVHGFRLAERAGGTTFADFDRLDVRLNITSLLRGHLWIRELILRNPTVHVVRFPTNEFNFSDLIRSSGGAGRMLDVTVDHFALLGGTTTLEDQALPERRTWLSENIAIEARNLSTRRDDGSAVGTSVTGGAPVTVAVERLRLYPIRLQATLTVEGLDLTLARFYLPPNAPVVVDRGRASTSVRVVLDARDGLRVDGTGRLEDVALVRPGGSEPVALVTQLTARLAGLAFQGGGLQVGQLEIAGSAAVLDPSRPSGNRFAPASVRASVADLTWPISTPAQLQLLTNVRDRGQLTVAGTLRPPTAASELRLRLADFDLAPWAGFLPVSARVSGVAEADLRVNEPITAGVPTRVQGSIAVRRPGVKDDRQEVLGAQRVEATGLEVHWPSRLMVKRLLVTGPRAIVERDKDGGFPLRGLWSRPPPAPPLTPAAHVGVAAPPTPPLTLDIGEIVVRDGAVAWRDAAVRPPARLDVSRIDASVTAVAWPLRGAVGVRVAARPPGGGEVRLAGRVGVDPLTADLRVGAKAADLAPYQPYLPTTALVDGSADFDLAVLLPAESAGRATVRGSVALSRVDVRDGQRTVMRAERAAATGVDVEWPERVGVRQLALQAPWLLIERDETGALPLRALLTLRAAKDGGTAPSPEDGAGALAVAVGRVAVEDGGMRVVDRSVSPAFAVDLQRLTLRVEGLATAPAPPARVDLTGQVGSASDLALRGTIGPIGGPLRIDVTGDLREFAVPRANPYLLRHVAWRAHEGLLTTNLRCRIQGDTLDARTEIRLSRLQVVRAADRDEAQARIGLPLGLIVALLKDKRGDIRVSFPVGGRLSDPRFEFSEAIWGAVRTVAIKAITLPVSWIGRVHLSPDSRVEKIQVHPVRFQAGTDTPTPEGHAQVARLAAFLEQTPEVRMALTPVVSSRDLEQLRRQALTTTLELLAREAQISPDAAGARLFKQRFPDRRAPESPGAILEALAASQPADASALATRRADTVRKTLKEAGIDPARLLQNKLVERPDAVEEGIALDLVEPDSPRRPQLLDRLRRLGGTKRGADFEDE